MEKVYLKRRCLWLIPLLLMMPVVKTLAQTLVDEYVIVDGIEYQIKSKSEAVAYSLAGNFTGTSVVLADHVEGVWKNGDVEEKVNVPVVNIYDSFLSYNTTVTSLTLPKNFVGEKTNVTYEGGGICTHYTLYLPDDHQAAGLREVLVAEGNPYFTSIDGLLCNATSDTLLYIPRQYIMGKEEWRVPEGIRSIPYFAYHSFNHNVSELGVKKIIFTSDIDYAYLCANDITLHNVTPPTLVGVDSKTILHVPVGSAPDYYEMYKEKRVFAVLEENTNIKSITQHNFGSTSVYDVNKDGHIDLVGTRTENVSGTNKSFFQFVNEDYVVHNDTIVVAPVSSNNNIYHIVQNPNNGKLQYVADGTIYQQTDENHCVCIFNEGYSLYVDVDNDGLKDVVSKYSSSNGLDINMQQPDGSFVKSKQYLTGKAEEATADGKGTIVTFLQGFLRNSMFVYDDASPFENLTKAVDFNNDGILDFIDDVAGGIMYSYGDGKYLTSKGKEIVYPVDIDNDGVLDYIVFDGQTIYLMDNVNSASSEKKELFKNSKIDNMFFKDFDHDGDIDILAFINNRTNSNYTSYFVFLRNNGDGTFRRKESSMADTQYTLVDCGDYDADGKYELLVIDHSYVNYNYKNDGLLLKVENDFTVSTISETFGIPQSSSYKDGKNLMLGDFNNDGFTEFYSNNGDIYGILKSQTIQNTVPKKMSKPTALLDAETYRLKITWARGEDKETSACDLTYALRIGTAPGLGDVLRPASLPDGRRKVIGNGEMGTALSTLFNAATLKPGKYYISVQAIDAGGLGGQFSDELEYEHQISAPKFYVSANELSTADTLEVYVKNTIPSASYEWITSEGKIIEKTDNKAKVVFYQSGIHELNLTTTLEGVEYKSEAQAVSVTIAKSLDGNCFVDAWPFDFNQDGFIDGFYPNGHWENNSYDNIDAYKNNGNGTYSQIQLSTFSDLNGYIGLVTDYNHDGYPDFIIGKCSKGNVFLNYGEQDYDFDYQTKDISLPQYAKRGIDLNNDGWPDFDTNVICYSEQFFKGYNWTSFKDLTSLDTYDYAIGHQFIDVNRDGFMDIVWGVKNQDETIVYCRLKDNTTDCVYGEPRVLFRSNQINTKETIFADFNNDGYIDWAYVDCPIETETELECALYIIKGTKDGESSEIVQKIDGVHYINNVLDINNDGYLDIPHVVQNAHFVSEGLSNSYEGDRKALLLKPDFGYEMSPFMDSFYWDITEMFALNNMGDMYLLDDDYRNNYQIKTNIQNQSPAAPASVAAKQTKDGMLITWSDAVDKETPDMQMRYNISVRRKGKNGENAFVISPMNGLKDEAAIVPGGDYKKSTQMLIPASVLTSGETYEIQVQAIDLWGAHSPMTSPIELTMENNGYIDMAERVATGKDTQVKFVGTQAASYSLQPGEGGTIVSDNGNGTYIVKWNTEGIKDVVINAGGTLVKSTITVVKPFDMTFSVPSYVLAGAPVAIKAPADMAEAVGKANWRCDDPNVEITYKSGDEYAYVLFPKAGTYKLEAYCTDSIRESSYQCTITIENVMPKATIKCVNTNGSNYDVEWDIAELPSYIDKVVVLREGKSLNQFITLDEVNAQQGHFVDQTSNSMVVSNRYSMMLVASNGQISEMSDIHKPLHVMLGYSAMGGYNLMWNGYEGLTVDNYQIWRGSSPETMELYEQVAGSQLNYTDLSPMAGVNYYSIVFNPQVAAARSMSRAYNDNSVSSNCISSNQAVNLVLAESIEIVTGSNKELTKNSKDLYLYCNILPAYSSISIVKWNIVEGSDLATIDSEGHLVAKEGKGNVIVRATTIDGSNLSADITIPCDVIYHIEGDIDDDGTVDISDAVATVDVILKNLTDEITIAKYDVTGDGEVDVFDVTKILGIVLSKQSIHAATRALNDYVAMESVHIATSDRGLWLGVNDAYRFTAFQFDVKVPEGTELSGVALLASNTKHKLQFAKTNENTYKVIGLSMHNELLSGPNDKLIELQFTGGQGGDAFINHVMFVTPTAEKTFFNGGRMAFGTTGIIEVMTGEENHDAYDLTGRKLGANKKNLRNGIYIINGKKILVK